MTNKFWQCPEITGQREGKKPRKKRILTKKQRIALVRIVAHIDFIKFYLRRDEAYGWLDGTSLYRICDKTGKVTCVIDCDREIAPLPPEPVDDKTLEMLDADLVHEAVKITKRLKQIIKKWMAND